MTGDTSDNEEDSIIASLGLCEYLDKTEVGCCDLLHVDHRDVTACTGTVGNYALVESG